jgi:hypothetical protein
MRELLLVVIFLTYASDRFAYGAIARGYVGGSIHFISLTNQPTLIDADIAVLSECRRRGLQNCDIVSRFQSICVSVAKTSMDFYDVASGQNGDQARQNAIATCRENRRNSCMEIASSCDQTPFVSPNQEKGAPDPRNALVFPPYEKRGVDNPQKALVPPPEKRANADSELASNIHDRLQRSLQVDQSAGYIAYGVAATLLVWLLVSIISTTPAPLLKWRVAIAAWIGGPLALAFVSVVFNFSIIVSVIPTAVLNPGIPLWTDVFAGLCIGVGSRSLLGGKPRTPALLSLPLANLVFTALSYAATRAVIEYGTFTKPSFCADTSASGQPICEYFQNEGICCLAAILIAIVIFGGVLPVDSNLIRANDWLPNRIGKVLSIRRQTPPISRSFDPINEPQPTRPDPPSSTHQDEYTAAIKNALRSKREEFDL